MQTGNLESQLGQKVVLRESIDTIVRDNIDPYAQYHRQQSCSQAPIMMPYYSLISRSSTTARQRMASGSFLANSSEETFYSPISEIHCWNFKIFLHSCSEDTF